MEFKDYLQILADRIGESEPLMPDADGMIMFDVDGMTVKLLDLPELYQLVLEGDAGQPPPVDGQSGLEHLLLEANYNFGGTGGATLSINHETGSVMLCRALDTRVTDGESFLSVLELFCNTLQTWRDIVSAYSGEGPVRDSGVADTVGSDMPLPVEPLSSSLISV